MSGGNDLVTALDYCRRLPDLMEAVAFCEPRYEGLDHASQVAASAAHVRAARRILGRPPLVSLAGAIAGLRKRRAPPTNTGVDQ